MKKLRIFKTRQEILQELDLLLYDLHKVYNLNNILFAGIPTGCFRFLADIADLIDDNYDPHFTILENKRIDMKKISNKPILCLVDCIYDTGATFRQVISDSDKESLLSFDRIIGLVCVKRYKSPTWDYPLISCFTFSKDNWLVGYGLDEKLNNKRHLDHLYYIDD